MFIFNAIAPTRAVLAVAFTGLALLLGVSAAEAHTNGGTAASHHKKSHRNKCSAHKKRIGGRCVPKIKSAPAPKPPAAKPPAAGGVPATEPSPAPESAPSPSAQAQADGQSQSPEAIGGRVQAAQSFDNGDGTTTVIVGPGTPEPGGVTTVCIAAANLYARYIYPYYYRNVWITNCDGSSYWYSADSEVTYRPDYAGYYGYGDTGWMLDNG
jgi:hypothetical protein